MSQKFIIFDLFGTLIGGANTEKTYFELLDTLFPRTKYKTLNDFISINDFGSIDVCITEGLKYLNIVSSEKNNEDFKQKLEEWKSNVQLQDGVDEVLAELKKRGVKLGLITNDNNFITDCIQRFKLNNFFDVMLCSHKLGIRKPDPEIFKMCVEKLGGTLSETIMVGDKLDRDVDAPRALGMKGILYDPLEENLEYPSRITSLKELL